MTDEVLYNFNDGRGPVPAHQHINGGGWVANTATVEPSVYVGPTARIYGDAWVYGNARIYGNAQIYGDAWVCGNAWVCDNAWVCSDAWVYGNAWVCGDARVCGDTRVGGDVQVKRGEYMDTPVSITRSDGYTFTLQSDGSIVAGCRDFTPEQAKAHWGDANHHKHAESMAIVRALELISAARSNPNLGEKTMTDEVLYDWNGTHEPYYYQVPAEHLNDMFNKLWWSVGRYFKSGAYVSDLLWDAELLCRKKVGTQTLFVIRSMGTNTFDSLDDAKAHVDHSDGLAVLRVIKRKHDYEISIIYRKHDNVKP